MCGRGLGARLAVVLSVWLWSRRRIERRRSATLGLTHRYLEKTSLNSTKSLLHAASQRFFPASLGRKATVFGVRSGETRGTIRR